MAASPVLSISQDGRNVVIHEHGPLPADDAALLLSRALAMLLAEIARSRSSNLSIVPSMIQPPHA